MGTKRATRRSRQAAPRVAPPPGLRTSTLEIFGGSVVVFSFPLEYAELASGGAGRMASLTPAEREVMRLALEGLPTAEIAERRGRSLATVSKQLEVVYRKLGVSSRVELAARFGDAPRR